MKDEDRSPIARLRRRLGYALITLAEKLLDVRALLFRPGDRADLQILGGGGGGSTGSSKFGGGGGGGGRDGFPPYVIRDVDKPGDTASTRFHRRIKARVEDMIDQIGSQDGDLTDQQNEELSALQALQEELEEQCRPIDDLDYTDQTFAPRKCSYCFTTYRGPMAYCSLRCDQLDHAEEFGDASDHSPTKGNTMQQTIHVNPPTIDDRIAAACEVRSHGASWQTNAFIMGVVVFLAILILLFALPAQAQDGLYLELRGGGSAVNESTLEDDSGDQVLLSYGTGWLQNGGVVEGAIGWRWQNGVRLEGAIGWRSNETENARVPGLGGGLPVDGETTATSAMLTAYYDFETPVEGLQPFVGLGGGMARVSLQGRYFDPTGCSAGSCVGFVDLVDDSADVLAGQVIVGLGYDFNDRVRLTGRYVYMATQDPSFTGASGDSFQSQYRSHAVMVGLAFGF